MSLRRFIRERLIQPLRTHSVRWVEVLQHDVLLSLFLALVGVSLHSFLFRFLVRGGGATWPLAVTVAIAGLGAIAYLTGILTSMAIVAGNTPAGRALHLRLAKLELAIILLYLFAFIFPAGFLMDRGMTSNPWVSALSALMTWLDRAHGQLAAVLGFHCTAVQLRLLANFHLIFSIPALIMLAVRSSPSELGFRLPLGEKWLWAVYLGFPLAGIVAQSLAGHGVVRATTATFAASLLIGFAEEFTFRAVLQTRLESVLRNPRWGIMASSLLFALIHLNVATADSLTSITNAVGQKTLDGFLLGYLYYRTRSLLPGAFLHGVVDVPILLAGG